MKTTHISSFTHTKGVWTILLVATVAWVATSAWAFRVAATANSTINVTPITNVANDAPQPPLARNTRNTALSQAEGEADLQTEISANAGLAAEEAARLTAEEELDELIRLQELSAGQATDLVEFSLQQQSTEPSAAADIEEETEPAKQLAGVDQAQDKFKERRIAEQRIAEQRIAEQRIAEQKIAEQKIAEQKIAEQKIAEQKIAEQKIAEQKIAEQKIAEQKIAEQKIAEQKIAEQKIAEQKIAEQKIAEQKIAEQKIAEQKIAEQQTTEQTEAIESNAEYAVRLAALRQLRLETQKIKAEKAAIAERERTEQLQQQAEQSRLSKEDQQTTVALLQEQQIRDAAAEAARRRSVEAQRLAAEQRLREDELRVLVGLSARLRFENRSEAVERPLEKTLDRMFDPLFLYAETPVVVTVSTNEFDDVADNNRLSRDRGKSIVDYLVSRGLEPDRFSVETLPGEGLLYGSHRVKVSVEEPVQ